MPAASLAPAGFHRLIAAGFLHFIRYLAGLWPRILKAAGIAPNFSPVCAVGAFGTHCRRSGITQIRLARWSPSSPPHLNPSVSPSREYPRPDGCDRACPVLPEVQFIGGLSGAALFYVCVGDRKGGRRPTGTASRPGLRWCATP